ncbi:ArsR/SmtB family transcription factor [Hamadaea tsunoensis]|uniref:ArsR/SmtB family transcription factor n=1 Tax=Hamadaea tsunoensis TaxID=53368 RepID=UPI000425045F|nr:helix-turn-helix domain-containing protein [Hamadaea tsunoensis]
MTRRISDPDVLKGLAQPVRQKIYRLLAQIGPATGGDLSRRLGTDPGQTSYHLRELAKRGFVEDVPELARDRRERWWRLIPGAVSWSNLEFEGPEGAAVASAAKAQMVIDEFERLRGYERTRTEWPLAWQQAAMSSDSFLRLTAEELAALNRELLAIVQAYAARTRDLPLGDGRENVFLFHHSFPERP